MIEAIEILRNRFDELERDYNQAKQQWSKAQKDNGAWVRVYKLRMENAVKRQAEVKHCIGLLENKC